MNPETSPSLDPPLDPSAAQKKGPRVILLMPVMVLLILVPFLFWYGTWFGKVLSAAEIEERLNSARQAQIEQAAGKQKIRQAQHALEQLSRLIQAGEDASSVYPVVIELSKHAEPVLRRSVVWLMGFARDNVSMREALVRALEDEDALVRCNAAMQLSLVDMDRARPVLHRALDPVQIKAEVAGRVIATIDVGLRLREGTNLLRVERDGVMSAIGAPFNGTLTSFAVKAGDQVEVGSVLCTMSPSSAQVVEVFKALAVAGDERDTKVIERFTKIGSGHESRVNDYARRAINLIRERLESARTEGPTPEDPTREDR